MKEKLYNVETIEELKGRQFTTFIYFLDDMLKDVVEIHHYDNDDGSTGVAIQAGTEIFMLWFQRSSCTYILQIKGSCYVSEQYHIEDYYTTVLLLLEKALSRKG